MRTANPVLSDKAFQRAHDQTFDQSNVMTVQGTGIKTGILLVLVVIAAGFSWNMAANQIPQALMPLMIGGAIVGLIAALVGFFKPTLSPYAAPVYAIAEGVFLGILSQIINAVYPGIAFQAICLTFGTLFSLLIAYQSGWIKATENFKLGVTAATGGIFLLYLVSWIMSMFNFGGLGFIHSNGIIGIGFSVFVVIIAALNLVLDFDFIERGAEAGAPKYMEWYGALGLLVTLVWLYVEILRLLMKLQSRD